MLDPRPQIDPILFARQFEAFCGYVEAKSPVAFTSFASHPFTDGTEGYKSDICRLGRQFLAFDDWKKTDVGTGRIAGLTIKAIELPAKAPFPGNNLVKWQPRYGEAARPHHPLHEARTSGIGLGEVETILYHLYRTGDDERSFQEMLNWFGAEYRLISYLFFLKDRSAYAPVLPTTFEKAFVLLGVDFKLQRRCAWTNYVGFLDLLGSLKSLLFEALQTEVSLLDAHTFAFILAHKMEAEGKQATVADYLGLAASERDALIKARVGQGQFRDRLLEYWGSCAVTGCTDRSLLRASHIRPWRASTTADRLNLFNGLLLSPSLDACFDAGLIAFDDDGRMMVSDRLSKSDAERLGLSSFFKLRKVDPAHREFLAYHRQSVFR